MGAIKEGDNPEDYYIEYNALRAYGGASLMGLLSITLVAGLGFAALGSVKSGAISLLPTKKTKTKKTSKLSKLTTKLPKRRKK